MLEKVVAEINKEIEDGKVLALAQEIEQPIREDIVDADVPLAGAKEEAKVEPPKKQEKKVQEEDDVIDLDEDNDASNEEDPSFTQFLSELKVPAKNKKELAQFINVLSEKASQVETIWANEEVKGINDFVKDGGDIATYLQSKAVTSQVKADIDVLTDMSAEEAYELSLKLKFKDDDYTEEDIQGFIDMQSPERVRQLGNQFKKNTLENLKEQLRRETDSSANLLKEQKQLAEGIRNEFKETANNLSKIGVVKISSADAVEYRHKIQEMTKDYKQTIKTLFPIVDGKPDVPVWTQNIAKILFHDENVKKVANKTKKNAETSANKEVFKNLGNIDGTSQVVSIRGGKAVSGEEVIDAMKKALNG